MIPHRIALTNFLRFGEGPNQTPGADLQFADGDPLCVLSGPNGIGKSAVFDAITYALFGCHRGGKGQGMDELIRHGTNGFRIDFEFSFGQHRYRIQKNHGRKSVERVWKDDAEVDVPNARNKVRAWVEAELGLTYEQFTASVLLKQGEADRIITAGGKERLEMLKQIIGVKPYEDLSRRLRDASTTAGRERDRLADALVGVDPVSAEELADAGAAVGRADAEWTTTRDAETLAAGRVEQARQFADQEQTLTRLDALLTAAADRRAAATEIRTKHARLIDLRAAVPTLTALLNARTDRDTATPERDRLRAEDTRLAEVVATAAAARDEARADAEGHREAVDEAAGRVRQHEQALTTARARRETAVAVADLDAKRAAFPPDLADQLAAAKVARDTADGDFTCAVAALSVTESEGHRRESERNAFNDVEVGVKCSRCGNPVTAEHADAERKRMDGELREWQGKRTATTQDKAAVAARAAEAKRVHDELARDQSALDRLEGNRLGLVRHSEPEPEPVAELDERITDLTRSLATDTATERTECTAATAAGTREREAETTRVTAEKQRTAGLGPLADADARLTTATVKLATLEGQLTGGWVETWNALTGDRLGELRAELTDLEQSGLVEQHRQLMEDDARLDEWERQRTQTRARIAALPAEARVPVADAEAALADAKREAEGAALRRSEADRRAKELSGRSARRAELEAAARAAESAADRLIRLDNLLGGAGLLRDLVRAAERQIVRFANETLRNLSAGELAVELDDAEDGPDKAFTLRVRRADSPQPVGVHYLSGSQKFRVAVAVALGIGRFATTGTQARPLESVIIDEGFGSLDRDGLRCMADELHRLKDAAGLKRIILVSHQEDFATRFPVGWHLATGPDDTTTATPFRR